MALWISRLFRAALLIVPLLLAIVVARLLYVTRPSAQTRDVETVALLVDAMTVETRPVVRIWTGYGTTRSMNASDVATEVGGRVIERPDWVEAGFSIERGTMLVRIEPKDFADQVSARTGVVRSIEAQLEGLDVEEARLGDQLELAEEETEIAKRNADRLVEARAGGAGSEREVDAALQAWRVAQRAETLLRQSLESIPSRRASLEAQLVAERANLRTSEENLARTTVDSPVSGLIQSVSVDVGEFVSPGQVVARVTDVSRIEVPLRVPVSALDSVRLGDPVVIRADGPSSAIWEGTVRRIAPEADAGSRSATVFVEVDQDLDADGYPIGDALLPGRFVTAEIRTSALQERAVLPRRAVIEGRVFAAIPNAEGGYRIEPRQVDVLYPIEARFPDLAPDERQWVVVEIGGVGTQVELGDVVVLSNFEQLRTGLLVRLGDEASGTPGVMTEREEQLDRDAGEATP